MIDESKRKAKRKTWMDDDCKIKSKKYKSYIFFEFSKKKIREKIDFQEKKTVKIGYDGKAINLKTKKGNCKELKEFVYS